MIASTVIGLGLPWPESLNALLEHYGGYKEVGDLLGIARRTVYNYTRGQSPKQQHTRQQFVDYGWTLAELPVRHLDAPRKQRARYKQISRDRKRARDSADRRSGKTQAAGDGVTFNSLMAARHSGQPRPIIKVLTHPIEVTPPRATPFTDAIIAICTATPATRLPTCFSQVTRLVAQGATAIFRKLRYRIAIEGTPDEEACYWTNSLMDRLPVTRLRELLKMKETQP